MLKDHLAKYYFDGNYNCAESVLRAANDYYELGLHDRDMILVGGYGAGIQTGNTCGAILGAVSVLSMKFIEKKAHESDNIKPVTTLFLEKCHARFENTLLCAPIKEANFAEGVRCLKTVESACDLLEETIKEYKAQ